MLSIYQPIINNLQVAFPVWRSRRMRRIS